MSARSFHMSSSGLGCRPLLAALIVYWIAIAAGALTLAFAARQDAASGCGAHLPFLAELAPGDASAPATIIGAV